uniref:Uncharacterized protein n=1 Tax=Anguilla anguilla TaxID=7936 RepID=A0A0E9QQS2_ANGAN
MPLMAKAVTLESSKALRLAVCLF